MHSYKIPKLTCQYTQLLPLLFQNPCTSLECIFYDTSLSFSYTCQTSFLSPGLGPASSGHHSEPVDQPFFKFLLVADKQNFGFAFQPYIRELCSRKTIWWISLIEVTASLSCETSLGFVLSSVCVSHAISNFHSLSPLSINNWFGEYKSTNTQGYDTDPAN